MYGTAAALSRACKRAKKEKKDKAETK